MSEIQESKRVCRQRLRASCPHCHINGCVVKLVAVLERDRRTDFAKYYTVEDFFHHLNCPGCGTWFDHDLAGQSVHQHLNKQAEDFKNPDSVPTHCPTCKDPVERFATRKASGARLFPHTIPDAWIEMTITYCPCNYAVLYVETPEQPRQDYGLSSRPPTSTE